MKPKPHAWLHLVNLWERNSFICEQGDFDSYTHTHTPQFPCDGKAVYHENDNALSVVWLAIFNNWIANSLFSCNTFPRAHTHTHNTFIVERTDINGNHHSMKMCVACLKHFSILISINTILMVLNERKTNRGIRGENRKTHSTLTLFMCE